VRPGDEPGGPAMDRRAFVTGALAAAGAAMAGCGADPATPRWPGLPGGLRADDVPSADRIHRWIERIVGRGVRRPGYEADAWTEEFVADQLERIGLDNVRLEPVPVTRWEPSEWSLEVTPVGGDTVALECFPLPYTAPVNALELELAAYDGADPTAVAGKASLYDARVVRLPATALVASGSAPRDLSGRVYDPDGTFEHGEHVLPHTVDRNRVVDASIAAGAAAFVGALLDYPGDSCRYFVPYDGRARPIPGVWVRGSDGAWLRDRLAAGPVRLRLGIDATAEPFESHNVIGELPGADDDIVMIGSHHDGPWASAVEDASGTSLVLAQAAFWASQPRRRRPHRMVFVLHAGHMCGGAGLHAYIEAHRDELDDVVLEVHLEHAARELAEAGDGLEPTGQPVPRWWFTSRLAPLETAVAEALEAEGVNRSMILAPDAFGEQPPTDGGYYHREGVPIVNFLTAPFYLFDQMDTVDKIDEEGLVPLTRATIRIVEWTGTVSAAGLRTAR
jgi:hypothetical protein